VNDPVMPASRPPRGELTAHTIVASVLVAALMGASYPYIVLKLGFGPNLSVVAAFFGFVFLSLFNLVLKTGYDRWQNNVVQTAGTSAAQTAFMCVLLGAFDILRRTPEAGFTLELTWWKSFLWLWAACTLGVLLAVPLRRHFIVEEKLPYADGLAAAETLIVLDPPRGKGTDPALIARARAAATALALGLFASALMMLLRKEAYMFKWLDDAWLSASVVGGIVIGKLYVGVYYSLLSVGSGMIIGVRINVWMMVGGVLGWIVAPWLLVKYGELPPGAKRNDVLFWVMWPATGMLVAGGLTALALRWRLIIDTFRSLKHAKLDGSDFPLAWVGIGIAICTVALCVVQGALLHMPVWMTLAAIILSLPLMLVGLRVLGETNWGPISALSNMMQGLFAVVAPGNITANMVASGTTGTIAVSSEAIIQDYKAGDVIGSTPRSLTWAQLLAVPIGALAVSLVYPALVDTYGEVGGPNLSSAISQKWALFAGFLKGGFDALPTSALWVLLAFSALGVLFTVLESKKELKPFVPSPTGIGIGILVPFMVIATMFIGSILGLIWKKAHPKSAEHNLIPFASGLIAGEALIAVLVPLLLWLGLGGH
jgi:putative OPT family oligopeptide transporter